MPIFIFFLFVMPLKKLFVTFVLLLFVKFFSLYWRIPGYEEYV